MDPQQERRKYKALWERRKRQKVKAQQSTLSEIIDFPDSDVDEIDQPTNSVELCATDHMTETAQPEHQQDEDLNALWEAIDQHETIPSDIEADIDGKMEPEQSLTEKLREWVNQYNIKHNAVDSLLSIWREQGYTDLPKTARTLMRTKNDFEMKDISGVSYTYLGLRKQLKANVLRYPKAALEHLSDLEISLNIDGLPLFRSTKNSVWPILVAIVSMDPKVVFPIAYAYGGTKPRDLDFLDDTINELQLVLAEGLEINENQHLEVKLRCIVCDAPARCMVKGVKLVSGYYGCDKCEQKGNWAKKVIYDQTSELILRTDQRFRDRCNAQHHLLDTPFTRLASLDMVKSFPIDYMHLVLLGVMKRFLLIWIRGPKTQRLGQRHIMEMDKRIDCLKNQIPECFARQPRRMNELDRWKATEFRLFLFYTGKVILKGILPEDQYQHFLTLNVAMLLLLGGRKDEVVYKYAESLLTYFVIRAMELYGKEVLVYNVHALIHLTDEARLYGNVDNCSAFIFESFMQKIKRSIRSGKNVLAQMVNRIEEQLHTPIRTLTKTENLKFVRPHNFYQLSDGSFVEIVGWACDSVSKTKLRCRVYDRIRSRPMFTDPLDSIDIGVTIFDKGDVTVRDLDCQLLRHRAIMFENPDDTHLTFMTVIHEL